MLLRCGLFPEFCGRIAGHVDFAAEPGLSLPQGRGQVRQSRIADHQKVDIAPGMLLAACDRPIHERANDPPLEWAEGRPERRHQAGGLVDQTAQLGKDRRSGVRLEVGARSLWRVSRMPPSTSALSSRWRLDGDVPRNCANSERNHHFSGCISVAVSTSPRTVGNKAANAAGLRITRKLLRKMRKHATLRLSARLPRHAAVPEA